MKFLLIIILTCASVINALPQLKSLFVENSNLGDKPLARIVENEILELLAAYNSEAPNELNKVQMAEWAVATDVTNETLKVELVKVVGKYAEFAKKYAIAMKDIDYKNISDETISRQIRLIQKLGTDILEENDLKNLTNTISKMETIYNNATICPYNDLTCEKKLTLDPDIDNIMATSTDYNELEYIWKEWHEKSGKLMRKDYGIYVDLVNKAAKLNGKEDYGELWREMYEDDDFINSVDKMWNDVKLLYDELHTYVRYKLQKIYHKQIKVDDELIPAHLFGNMWAQSWVNLYDRIKPFENGSLVDVTAAMIDKGYTPKKMFEISDEFYKGLGLKPNDMSYNPPSIIVKPLNKTIACHASAWDFIDGSDFRIKMCTSVNMRDFITIHHEMGHIQYFIQYKDQPVALRDGANPGFHEAIGDTIALSVATPQHLMKIGLLENYGDSYEDNINSLFRMALERVAFLPFGLLIDKWRWNVFSKQVTEDHWNEHWWELREKYQKIKAPISRSENDFDPGAKYHVPANSKYISYFIAHILEFHLHKSLCLLAKQYEPQNPMKPLHKCDIDQSKLAGDVLSKGLKLGFSRHWSVALKEMTGDTKLTGESIMEYFEPLYNFLKIENSKQKEQIMKVDNKDDSDSNIPIIIGGIIGGCLVIALIVYGIYHWKNNKN